MSDRPARRDAAAVVGVISDTHGLLRPQAVVALAGCNCILHAGDIGQAEVLERLRAIAPLVAVRGNVDRGWAKALPETTQVDIAGRRILLLHNLAELEIDPRSAGIDVVIAGHSHRPKIESRDGVLYVNPGSAGPRRFTLPIAVAKIEITERSVEAQIIALSV
jgi:putative phosphoesterase